MFIVCSYAVMLYHCPRFEKVDAFKCMFNPPNIMYVHVRPKSGARSSVLVIGSCLSYLCFVYCFFYNTSHPVPSTNCIMKDVCFFSIFFCEMVAMKTNYNLEIN